MTKKRRTAPRSSNKLVGPSTAQINEALRLAVQDAVLAHQQSGLPLVVWENGQIALIPADQVEVPNGGKRSSKA